MRKNGVAIMVSYQAAKAATGKTILMDVFDETQTLDAGKSVAAMTEIGTTGRYFASFTPDAEGEWIVQMYETGGNKGHVVKSYVVVGHDIDSIGDEVALVKAQTDLIPSDPAEQSLVDSSIAAAHVTTDAVIAGSESDIRGADSDDLKTLSDQLDGVESPAMAG